MLVYMSTKGLFMFVWKSFEVSFRLEEFDNGLFYVGEGEKFFYTHLGGVL